MKFPTTFIIYNFFVAPQIMELASVKMKLEQFLKNAVWYTL